MQFDFLVLCSMIACQRACKNEFFTRSALIQPLNGDFDWENLNALLQRTDVQGRVGGAAPREAPPKQSASGK